MSNFQRKKTKVRKRHTPVMVEVEDFLTVGNTSVCVRWGWGGGGENKDTADELHDLQ